ncbi:MAG: isopenicillin N synthase family oxygenase [Myxococcales bacterium]|nr:isopenicillin N synthase family oxygenase [Myxococcales bacterium]
MSSQTIPVVDLRRFLDGDADDQRGFVDALGHALVEYGFVAVDRHGIQRPTLEAAYGAVKALFALPTEVKRRYEDEAVGRQRGYTSFGLEKAKDVGVPDLKEFWHIGPELDDTHPQFEKLPKNLWPAELPELRDAALGLWTGLGKVAVTLLRAIARYLDADEHELVRMIDGGNTVLRVIHYPPPDPEDAAKGAVWSAAHEDINLITLLPEATEPGLELLTRDGKWLPIAPIPGQLIADTGDIMLRLTNGFMPATTHRVVASKEVTRERYSMPYFVHPTPDYLLRPLSSCVTPANPRRYPDITAQELLFERLRENGVAKTVPHAGA